MGEKTPYTTWFYHGCSMGRTFRPGDQLYVLPVSLESIRPGDVILFRGVGEEGIYLVHRVRSRTGAGLLTQGDDCLSPDSVPVTAERLVGRVCFLERKWRIRPVWGGWAGRLWAAWLRLRRRVIRMAGRPYRWLQASGLVRRWWRPSIERIHLQEGGRSRVKYLHRGRTVACYWPEEGRFWCRRPYDLVLEFPPPPSHPAETEALGSPDGLPSPQGSQRGAGSKPMPPRSR